MTEENGAERVIVLRDAEPEKLSLAAQDSYDPQDPIASEFDRADEWRRARYEAQQSLI